MENLYSKLQDHKPLVLNLANMVTPQHVADAINVIGGSPLMTRSIDEVAELVSIAGAVVLNIGTIRADEFALFEAVGQMANAQGKPVVLDPVAVGMPFRGQFVTRLLDSVQVDIIRGNAAEISWFAQQQTAGQGIDALTATTDVAMAQTVAHRTGAIVVASGATDVITDGKQVALVQNNVQLLAVNVGAGDMLSGLIATFAAVTSDYYGAALYATALLGAAGQQATVSAQGLPGRFMPALFDELSVADDAYITKYAEVTQ